MTNPISISIVFLTTIVLTHTLPSPIANTNDEYACRTDDGRIQIPINGKLRSATNPCRVCTCTITGLICEDQCDSNSVVSSTSTESTKMLSTLSSSSEPLVLASSVSPSTVPMVTANSSTVSSTTSDDDITAIINSGPCSRKAAAAREYAFVDCSEVYLAGKRTSGIYEIWPRTSPRPFRVLCDMDTDGGGWTILQRRGDFPQQSNFFVSWSSYKRGFGDLTRDFWLGNEKIYALTNQDEYRLHIDMEDFTNQSRFVDYEWFFVTSEQTKYTLNLGRYLTTSTAGDSLSYNRGMRFSTRDQDNDQSTSDQCAENYKSGWWYAGCTLANLNGLYLRGNDSTVTGVFWNGWLGAKYSLKVCEIKVRPTGFNTEMLS